MKPKSEQEGKSEKAQRKAARFAENNYCRETGKAAKMPEDLCRSTWQIQRKCAHIVIFYEIINDEADMKFPWYAVVQKILTRRGVRNCKELYPAKTVHRLLQMFVDCYNRSF